MQVNCAECGNKAIITSRQVLDPKLANLYCVCKNAECGHSFVMNLAFSHTLSPSSFQAKRMMIEMLRGMGRAEQLELLAQAQHNAGAI
ncbi:ogr/Delta-like zinc finger family protein [Hahella sp. HN01]|uniref:ogr/Delta-like zinc finger family protein n=1 Tax=Hahella sp. HN01 TaxID=2847262 RepID=UPI001C1EEC16|nr:ogr/Delta-like zinc finger family protein [Hahella sp. HN01]MBU6951010.1 ogr/Delta-like zinc finger family protein [Hahella sp. HN01]